MTKKALLDACAMFGMPIKDTFFTPLAPHLSTTPQTPRQIDRVK